MSKRSHEERLGRVHWEELVRTMIDILGPEQLAEVVDYVIEQKDAERRRLVDFAVECECVEP